MKPYHEGMFEVTQFFEGCAKKGVPDDVLDQLELWMEEVLPAFLREKVSKADRRKGCRRKQVFLNTERLLPALKKRIKQLGFDFTRGAAILVLSLVLVGCSGLPFRKKAEASPPSSRAFTGFATLRGDFGVDVVRPDGRNGMIRLPKGSVIYTKEEGGFEYVEPVREKPKTVPSVQARDNGEDGEGERERSMAVSLLRG